MATKFLQLVQGKEHYINLHTCDYLDICATSGHTYPILLDETPPLAPIGMLPDTGCV
jgi:hypothetical protein